MFKYIMRTLKTCSIHSNILNIYSIYSVYYALHIQYIYIYILTVGATPDDCTLRCNI